MYFCGAFGHLGFTGKKCSGCQHPVKSHKWNSTEWEEKSEDIIDDDFVKLLNSTTNDKTAKERMIQILDQRLLDYQKEQTRIYEISIQLSKFIFDESIILHNGSVGDNFSYEIRKAQNDGKPEVQASLVKSLEEYNRIKSLIDRQLEEARTNNSFTNLTLDDLSTCVKNCLHFHSMELISNK